MSYLSSYLKNTSNRQRDSATIAYLASIDHITKTHPGIAKLIKDELKDQRAYLKMIASENYSSLATQLTAGNLLTDKYSEGRIGHRFYAGCENIDQVEKLAVQELKDIYGCDHAYVQPHSGADANLVAFWAILVKEIESKEVERLGKKNVNELSSEEYEKIRTMMVNQKIMGLSLDSGGHLTHGYRHNISGKMMRSVTYSVDRRTNRIDYKQLSDQVKREKPKILIGGYSAYPRLLNFAKMREIADSVGAVLLVDMAHFSGLVAGKALQGDYDPVPYAQVITSTTHKSLRGPRGGIILCQSDYKEVIDKGCPLVLGGPLPHLMAAKAVAFKEANTPEFQLYAKQIIYNAQAFADQFLKRGVKLFTGGTDNHLVVLDVASSFKLTGRQAELALRQGRMTVNRNMIPFDQNGPWYTSGVRIGTSALTTLGMKEDQMRQIADLMVDLLKGTHAAHSNNDGNLSKVKVEIDAQVMERVKKEAADLLALFPLYPELEL